MIFVDANRKTVGLTKKIGKKYAFSTLKLYRQFYLIYLQLQREISAFLVDSSIGQSVISQLGSDQNLNKDSKYEIMAIKGAWSVRELQRQIRRTQLDSYNFN